jgi:DNA gyrase subunit A
MAKKKQKEIVYSSAVYDVAFEEVMHNSMLPYSENVILDRALPRVEDGLKPVQRRILYSMYEMGITPDKPYKKCARIVGDCLGKYHPHGDSSVYGALVRMAQPFAMGMKLVDGHGNFGSVDGDGAAAMRYTEARMAPLALELLRDLDKETVSWAPNFDDSLEEPTILPGRFPNLLVNGANGIAVGLATNIPTHNMAESIDAVVAMIDNPSITTAELLKVFKGPDFPTGGFIVPVDSLESIYETGKGRIKIRSRLHIEDDDNGKKNIVITELPYQVNKAELLTKIADLREANKDLLSGISDIVDESDKQGMRAVIKLKKDAPVDKIVAFLMKKSNLEIGYSVNIVAIAGGKPEQLGLRDILKYYIAYQREIIVKRTTFDLKAAKARAEIVKGLLVAIANIDEVIAIIKTSETTAKAKATLRERFDLSDEQAQAILDMRLKALARLEVGKLEEELQRLEKLISKLTAILGSKTKQYAVVKEEILEIKKNNPSPRLSVILGAEDLGKVDLPTAEEAVAYREGVFVLNDAGTIRFMSQKSYSLALKDMSQYGEAELPKQVLHVNNKGSLFAFTNRGNLVKIDVTSLPETRWREKGVTIGSLNPEVSTGESVVKAFFFDSTPVGEFLFFTKQGMVKRTDVAEYTNTKAFVNAIILGEGDSLLSVELVDDEKNVFEVTEDGQCLLYNPLEVPLQGRKAGGVKGVKLGDGDSIAYGGLIEEEGEVLVVTTTGYTKRVISSTLEPTSRYLKGVKIVELDKSKVKYVNIVKDPYDIAVVTGGKTYILNTEDVRIDTRTTKGKQLYKTPVTLVTKVSE